MTVTVRDRGASGLVRTAIALRAGPSVDVGILGSDSRSDAEGITNALLAQWAEFGIGQPQRSWLRAFVDERQAEIEAVVKAETREILAGRRTQAQALRRLGVWLQGQIQARIAAGIQPPNAEETIRRKGSSTPLIDTGHLRASITHRVNER